VSRCRNLVVGWALAVLAIALFLWAGVWQAQRAVEKQAMLDAASRVLAARKPQPLAFAAADTRRAREYDWSEGAGAFVEGERWLLDNQMRNGRAGVRVYGVFFAHKPLEAALSPTVPPPPPQSTVVLVDLGWVAMPADRRLDEQRISQLLFRSGKGSVEGTRWLRGMLAPPPASGLSMGPAYQRVGRYQLMTRIDLAQMAPALGTLAPRVLRLDPALPLGYERDLELLPNTLPPERHRGYSLQWFALATAVLVTAVILTFRKPRRHEQH